MQVTSTSSGQVLRLRCAQVLVEVGAAQEVSAGPADEFAAAVFEAGAAGGAEAGVVFGVDWADWGSEFWRGRRGGSWGHLAMLAHYVIFSTSFRVVSASKKLP
jgi:hypothetical protein